MAPNLMIERFDTGGRRRNENNHVIGIECKLTCPISPPIVVTGLRFFARHKKNAINANKRTVSPNDVPMAA